MDSIQPSAQRLLLEPRMTVMLRHAVRPSSIRGSMIVMTHHHAKYIFVELGAAAQPSQSQTEGNEQADKFLGRNGVFAHAKFPKGNAEPCNRDQNNSWKVRKSDF